MPGDLTLCPVVVQDIHGRKKSTLAESRENISSVLFTIYGVRMKVPRGARVQPLTRGPEADETRTMTAARPQHACVRPSKRRQHHPVRSTCAAASSVRSSPLGANTVCKPRNSFADALFRQGLMALMQPTIWCVRAQSAREFVAEFSGGATPHREKRCVARSYELEL